MGGIKHTAKKSDLSAVEVDDEARGNEGGEGGTKKDTGLAGDADLGEVGQNGSSHQSPSQNSTMDDALREENEDGRYKFKDTHEIAAVWLHAKGGEELDFNFGADKFEISGPAEEGGEEESKDEGEDLREIHAGGFLGCVKRDVFVLQKGGETAVGGDVEIVDGELAETGFAGGGEQFL